MNRISSLAFFTVLTVAITGGIAKAETIDKQFDDFFSKQQKYENEARKKREDGFVLQRFHDPSGRDQGRLSIGGGPDPEPVYNEPTNFNFGGRDFNDPDEGGVLNLRLKF